MVKIVTFVKIHANANRASLTPISNNQNLPVLANAIATLAARKRLNLKKLLVLATIANAIPAPLHQINHRLEETAKGTIKCVVARIHVNVDFAHLYRNRPPLAIVQIRVNANRAVILIKKNQLVNRRLVIVTASRVKITNLITEEEAFLRQDVPAKIHALVNFARLRIAS